MSPKTACIICFLVAGQAVAWHGPPHQKITRAAVMSLPAEPRQMFAGEDEALIEVHCKLPDTYRISRNPADPRYKDGRWRQLQVYCVKPDDTEVHNVTWNHEEDLGSLEYVMSGMIASLKRDDPVAAAKYAGSLAHFLEDSTCPAHSMIGPLRDASLQIFLELLPAPPDMKDVNIHRAIEFSAPDFNLERRRPQRVGETVSEAARALLDRTYEGVRLNRKNLLATVQALFAGDQETLDRHRAEAARYGAELLADAFYTTLLLAREAGAFRVYHTSGTTRR